MTCGLTNTLMGLQTITQQHPIVSDSENNKLLNGLTFYSGLMDQFNNGGKRRNLKVSVMPQIVRDTSVVSDNFFPESFAFLE